MFKKILALTLTVVMIAALCVSFASCGKKRLGEGEEILPRKAISSNVTVPADFKIGLITLHDENSTYDKNFIDAFVQVCEGMGIAKENYFIVSNVPEGDECYDTAVDLAKNKGCKVIFADSFGHEAHMLKAAKEYPNVQFCHATGTSSKYLDDASITNFHNAFAAIYEGRYIAGIVAGKKLNEMIDSGKIKAEEAVIGYVGAFTYAEVVSGLTSFYLGAKSVCPSATMKVRYTGSWYDQAKEQEAANALIKKDKCVLISQHADSLGAPKACQKKKVPNVSYNGSTYTAGKDTWLVSSAINWAPYFQGIIEATAMGVEIPADFAGDIDSNSVVLSGLNQDVVAAGTKEAVEAAIAKFKAGTLKVFDVSTFTVTVTDTLNKNATVDANKHLTAYMADVDTDAAFTGDTNVIVTDGNVTYFAESVFRSAPYFDIQIDGITYLNTAF